MWLLEKKSMCGSHSIFIEHRGFRSASSRYSSSLAPWTHCASSPPRVFACAIPSLSTLWSVRPYLSFSSLYNPHLLKENNSDLLALVEFPSNLSSHHVGSHLCSICHSGDFTTVCLLDTLSSMLPTYTLNCQFPEARNHACFCSWFSPSG